jgi:RNA polymerase sigma-70 factor (ECF subfamily)
VDDSTPHQHEIARLAAGDMAAFARLYDRLGARLYATARRMTGSDEAAEDAVQEVFVTLARGRENLALVSDLDGYVFTSLRHAIGRRWRSMASQRRSLEGLRRMIEEIHGSDGRVMPAPTLADDELAAAVAALPEAQREVVALRVDGGLSFEEIAAATGTSPNTAASRYRYALEKLRVSLGAVADIFRHPVQP